MTKQRMERGQVLVLIILAIVALFGFAALAVDVGRLYAERRRIQSAADSAALSAAYAASQGNDYITAAINQFALNDIDDPDRNENLDIDVDVEVYNPPVDGPYGPTSDLTLEQREQYFQVYVRSKVDAVFSQFVYGGPLEVRVESTARYTDAGAIYSGGAMVALSPTVCKALWFAGSAGTEVTGGSIYSFSTAGSGDLAAGDVCQEDTIQGPASCASGVKGGSGSVLVPNGGIYTSGPWLENGSAGVVGTASGINQCEDNPVREYISEPDCSGLPARTYNNGSGTLLPGIYPEITVTGKKHLLLSPGMYCLNGDFRMSGGSLTGNGVLINMRSGSFDLTGQATVNLTAANSSTINPSSTDEINDYTGLLIYMRYENPGQIFMGGGSGTEYTGTIYAPGPTSHPESQYKCTVIGSGASIGLNSSLICDTIKIDGSATVHINYDEDTGYQRPPSIDQVQ